MTKNYMGDASPDEERELPQPTWTARCCPCMDMWAQLEKNFGAYPIAALSGVYLIAKGILFQVLTAVQLPLYRDVLGVTDAATYQRLTNVPSIAWAAKPAIGIGVDWYPLGGYKRRGYMMLFSVLLAVSIASAAFVASSNSKSTQEHRAEGSSHHAEGTSRGPITGPVLLTAALFFAMNFGMAALDLLSESKYSELIMQQPHTGSLLVSWVWGLAMAGGVVGSILEGPAADKNGARQLLLVMVPLAILVAWPFYRNWLGETHLPPRPKVTRERDRVRLLEQGEESSPRASRVASVVAGIIDSCDAALAPGITDPNERRLRRLIGLYGSAMSVAAMLFAVVALSSSAMVTLAVTVVLVLFLAFGSFYCLPPLAAMANLFMFLKEALYVQIPGALDYWFTAPPSCVPNGPHFSYFYYQTFTAIVGNVAGIAGVVAFHRFFAKRSFRLVFFVTTMVKIVASLVDVVMVTRFNVRTLQISDKATYLLGDAIVFSACYMLDFMPAAVLIAKLCPKGLEATMYALLAGFSNFGQVVSRTIGSLLMEAFGIRTDESLSSKSKESCDFRHLPHLVVFAHCLLPLLILPLIVLLVPKANVDEALEAADSDTDSQHDVEELEEVPPAT